jgi:magnesium-transporting ATPase (P-type)
VGLAMGTGTKVAKEAADIVILDDKFSSIIQAILWGRSVFDNIRKFLQFQLTVNVVALCLVFIGAVAGLDTPLNAVMMLWVNMIMDSMGALALGTEIPTPELLKRRPYRRDAFLLTRPMLRNIFVQATFQLVMLLILLFDGAELFGVNEGNHCLRWAIDKQSHAAWNADSLERLAATESSSPAAITCRSLCGALDSTSVSTSCVDQIYGHAKAVEIGDECYKFCEHFDYTHYSIIFTVFVFSQLFNEFNSRRLNNEWNVFKGISKNSIFILIILVTIAIQVIVVECAGVFVKTSHLTVGQWFICFGLGALSLPVGFLAKFIPANEDPNTFFVTDMQVSD